MTTSWDIRPHVHERIDDALRRALDEVPEGVAMTEGSIRGVADRAAELLGIPPGYFEVDMEHSPCPAVKYVGDCRELARLRGWRHG